MKENLHIESNCIHGTYRAASGQPQTLPIVQSTTYRYYDSADVAKLFDLDSADHMYSRISNPTVNALEEKMALLEDGTAAVCTSSGQAASLTACLNICTAGDHILCSSNVYGGTSNLLGVSLKKLGIETTFLTPELTREEILAKARPNTKLIFGETLGNPALSVLDFEKYASVAKELNIPFIVDNTLATPYLCRPLEHGANIVVHSTTKYSDGHALAVGGCVIDGGNFDWRAAGKYPGLCEPDESYHGLVYVDKFPTCPFALKLRAQLLRDFGCTMSPMNAFLTHLGLETLHLRMERHVKNAQALAEYLAKSPYVDWVFYPGLADNPYYELSKKYMPLGAGGVLTFGIKGGLAAGNEFVKQLKLFSLAVHVGDIRSCVLHPSSTTHRQLSEAEQIAAGIKPELIRVSVGCENIEDIIADFEQALKAAAR
ncbi:MAG: O-acetylhomoserine aminocarboxypropyltransferase/cysteine synthase [Clostridia bacterium]|nr:O-acetylhomoserine aminocarboxypropyltransferase/cysteine synthase [Clostridia bacterium]